MCLMRSLVCLHHPCFRHSDQPVLGDPSQADLASLRTPHSLMSMTKGSASGFANFFDKDASAADLKAAELMLASNVRSDAEKMDNAEDAGSAAAAPAGIADAAVKSEAIGSGEEFRLSRGQTEGANELQVKAIAPQVTCAAAAGDLAVPEEGKSSLDDKRLSQESTRLMEGAHNGLDVEKMVKMVTPLPTLPVVYSTPAGADQGEGSMEADRTQQSSSALVATTTPLTVPRQRRNARALPIDDEGERGVLSPSKTGRKSEGVDTPVSLPSPSKKVMGRGVQPSTPGTRASKRKQGQMDGVEGLDNAEKLPSTPDQGAGEGKEGGAGRRTSERKRGKRGDWPSSPSTSKLIVA